MSDQTTFTQMLDPRLERWLTPAALVIGNLIPLFGVLLFDWDVGAIVMVYWAENVVIGAITLLKMFATNPLATPFMGTFFLVHYGGFCAVHGFFAGMFFGLPVDGAMGGDWPLFFVFVEMLFEVIVVVVGNAPPAWLYAIAAIAASHLVSLVVHFFLRGEGRDATMQSLMTAPYKRIVVLHIAIIAGGFLVMSLGSPVGLLLILVLLKIGVDVRFHLKSHKLLKPAVPEDERPDRRVAA